MNRAEKKLVELFLRNGYMRYPNDERQENEGHQVYKKGWEIRWAAFGEEEQAMIHQLLLEAGFIPGNPYPKRNRFILPVYGREAVERFQKLLLRY